MAGFFGFCLRLVLCSWAWFYYLVPGFGRRYVEWKLMWFLRLLHLRRKVIRQNLEYAYPGDIETQRRIENAFYGHLSRLVWTIVLLFGPVRQFCQKHVVIKGQEHWLKALEPGKGLIFLGSHLGNWELMAGGGAIQAEQPVLVVTKILKPIWFHAEIEAGRMRCGVRGTYEPRTLRDILSFLKKNHTIGFVLDQYAGPPVGIRVPFFGQTVGTQSALATLIKRTGAVVAPALNYWDKDLQKWVIEIQPALEWIAHENPKMELALNTAHYTRIIEGHIRSHPEQWLWTHRRFKGDLSPLDPEEWGGSRARS